MAAKLITKNKRSSPLQFRGWPYQFKDTGPCSCSYGPVFLNHNRHANSFSKYTKIRGPSDLLAAADYWDKAYRLRAAGLQRSINILTDKNRAMRTLICA